MVYGSLKITFFNQTLQKYINLLQVHGTLKLRSTVLKIKLAKITIKTFILYIFNKLILHKNELINGVIVLVITVPVKQLAEGPDRFIERATKVRVR